MGSGFRTERGPYKEDQKILRSGFRRCLGLWSHLSTDHFGGVYIVVPLSETIGLISGFGIRITYPDNASLSLFLLPIWNPISQL